MTLGVMLTQLISHSDYKRVWEGEYIPSKEVIVSIYRNPEPALRETYALIELSNDISPEFIEGKKIGSCYFIVQERIKGKPLSKLKINSDLAYDLGKIVAEVHNARILHGDLHSDNILVTRSGGIKIIDWEYSCFVPKENGTKYVTLDICSILMDLKWRSVEFLEGYFQNTNYDARGLLRRLEEIITKFGSSVTQKKVIQEFKLRF